MGKTSLIRRFANNEFVAKYEPTIGADLTVKEVVVDGHDVAVQVCVIAACDCRLFH